MLPSASVKTIVNTFFISAVVATSIFGANDEVKKNKKTSEVEKGYVSKDIQKGWAFGDDSARNEEGEGEVQTAIKKTKRDIPTILEEILAINKEQLKEQKKIRSILEEQFDPKPKTITKADGTKCIANSSADCFDFPLIAEAKRVPVMANYLQHPEDAKAVAEWKKWFAKYLNHNFDIGKATEYDTATNGSNSFQTDYRTDGFDSYGGYFNVAKEEHNKEILNAFGKKSLSLKMYFGKTKDLDLYSVDQVALFCKDFPDIPIELIFLTKESADIYAGAASSLDFVRSAFSQPNVKRRVAAKGEIPDTLQATPAYSPTYKDDKREITKIIKNGKVSSSKLANGIIEWMIFEKIVNPAQLNDAKVWKDSGNYGVDYIKNTYNVDVTRGRSR